MTIHHLKILPEFFQAVKAGIKKFECRINDRDYTVGDILDLKEWDGNYTGNHLRVKVTYMLSDTQYVKNDNVIMSIEAIK